jgi:hypothetical protein
MSDKKIPLGISVITIIMYIQAIFGIAAGIFLIVDKDALAHDISGINETTLLYYGIATIVVATITGLLAMGLRAGSNGVRLFIAVIMVFHLAIGVWGLIAFPGARIAGLMQALLAGVVLYFLYGSEDSNEFFA